MHCVFAAVAGVGAPAEILKKPGGMTMMSIAI